MPQIPSFLQPFPISPQSGNITNWSTIVFFHAIIYFCGQHVLNHHVVFAHPELCESPWTPTQWFTSHSGTIATQRLAPGIIVRKASTECRLGTNGKGMLMFLPLQPLSWAKEYIYIYKFQKEILVVTSSRGIPYGHKATYIYNQSKKINTVLTSVSATFSDQEMTRQTGSRDIHPCFSLSGSVLIPLKKNHINHQLGHIYIYT